MLRKPHCAPHSKFADHTGSRARTGRFELTQIINERAVLAAEMLTLPPVMDPNSFALGNLNLELSLMTAPAKVSGGLDAARALAALNLSWLPKPLPVDATFTRAIDWLKHNRLQPKSFASNVRGDAAALLALGCVERLLFEHACKLNVSGALSKSEALAIESVVDIYRDIMDAFRGLKAADHLLQTELRSLETLVVWAAFCLTHKATVQMHPLLSQFGVALSAEELRHLVLSHKLARDAALVVASYLRANTNSKPVFSLLCSDQTFAFGQQFVTSAPGGADMRSAWAQETKAATRRQQDHTAEVRRKQERLRVLDAELERLKSKLDEWRSERQQCEPPRATSYYRNGLVRIQGTSASNDTRYQEATSQISVYESFVAAKRQEIGTEEIPPAPIFQPLPAAQDKAYRVLFDLLLPAELQQLSRLSFTAQQMLLPLSDKVKLPTEEVINIDGRIKVEKGPNTTWNSYYSSTSTGRERTANPNNKIVFGSCSSVPSRNDVQRDNVRSYRPPAVVPGPGDGVWHPDNLAPGHGGCGSLFWSGGKCSLDERNGGFFDPFAAIPGSAKVVSFTERLPEAYSGMQWAMNQFGNISDGFGLARGNLAEAWQDEKPSWLSRQEYLTFGKLRAFPNQQMREVCVAMHERGLPMGNAAVRLIMQVTLFHLGDLSTEEPPRPLWRTDLAEKDGWAVLQNELSSYAEELKFKSREHPAVLLLGQIAAHASQWDKDSRDVAREFARISISWAKQLEEQLEIAKPSDVPALRARRCLFYMYGIVCYGAGELSATDAAELSQLVVLADYNRLFEDPTAYDAEVHELTAITSSVLARRMPDLLHLVNDNPTVLTAAVKLVLHAAPDSLDWRQLVVSSTSTSCFESVAPTGTSTRISRNLFESHCFTRALCAFLLGRRSLQLEPADGDRPG